MDDFNISVKLNNISEIKNALKNKLINIGLRISDETTFREYSNLIGDIKNKAPITTEELNKFTKLAISINGEKA